MNGPYWNLTNENAVFGPDLWRFKPYDLKLAHFIDTVLKKANPNHVG